MNCGEGAVGEKGEREGGCVPALEALLGPPPWGEAPANAGRVPAASSVAEARPWDAGSCKCS